MRTGKNWRGSGTCISDQLEPDTLYIGNIGLTPEHSLGTDLESDAGDFCSESTKTLYVEGRREDDEGRREERGGRRTG